MAQTCIIVDQNINHAIKTRELLEKVLPSSSFKTFKSLDEAEKTLGVHKSMNVIDIFILFLDITGTDIGQLIIDDKLRSKCRHIMLTADADQSAQMLFDLKIDGFFIKPIRLTKLRHTIEHLINRSYPITCPAVPGDFFFIDNVENGRKVKCNINELMVVESDDHLVKLITVRSTFLAHHTIKDMDNALRNTNMFVRIQRSFIVSINYIDYIAKGVVTIKGSGLQIQVGKKYQDRLANIIDEKHLKNKIFTSPSSPRQPS